MEYCCICGRSIAACNCAYSSGTWKTVLYRTAWNGTDYNDYNTGTYTVTYYPNVKDGAWNIGKTKASPDMEVMENIFMTPTG